MTLFTLHSWLIGSLFLLYVMDASVKGLSQSPVKNDLAQMGVKTSASALGAARNDNAPQSQQQHHRKRHKKVHNFIFGYGSLICPESRSISNPGLANQEGLPVVIQDVERVWSARTSSGYTAMGVHFKAGAECTGVLIEVDAEQLKDLDKREANYQRFPIHLDNIDQVPFLEEDEFYDSDHPVFEAKESSASDSAEENGLTEEDAVKVWIYVQKDPIPADPSHPIPQSYVDIILRGCLTISEDFAKSFIENTAGWQHDEDHWVDDREVPIYRRADPEFSNEHGDKIDNLFEQHDAVDLEERVEYDPVDHLDALADALEEEMAHPKAIKHVVKRVRQATAIGDDTNTENKN